MTQSVVHVNAQGRVVIPAELRRKLGIGRGSILVAYIEDRRLVLEDRDRLLSRIQDEVTAHVPPGVSLTGELHTERGLEAALE